MQAATQVWRNDNELDTLLGEWWTQDMELHNDATGEMNVQSANFALEERGYGMRVVQCKEADDGDSNDWLCEGTLVTAKQKARALETLLSYASGQMTGAETSVNDAAEDDDNEQGCAAGHMGDAIDVLGIAREFADNGNLDKMCSEVRLLDTLVREDLWEKMCDLLEDNNRELLEMLSERIGYDVEQG